MKLNEYIASFDNRMEARKNLAEALGVSEITVRSWANGNRHPDRKKLAAIVKATGGSVTIHDLIEDHNNAD